MTTTPTAPNEKADLEEVATPAWLCPTAETPRERVQTMALRMTALVESFPTLVGLAGVRPWDAVQFDLNRGLSHGGRCAQQFVLSVWNPSTSTMPRGKGWRCGRFDLQDALCVWDDRHRRAFLAWASQPWWP